jgi:hypothetical protein
LLRFVLIADTVIATISFVSCMREVNFASGKRFDSTIISSQKRVSSASSSTIFSLLMKSAVDFARHAAQ